MSHAGVALLRALADNIGLTAGLSKANKAWQAAALTASTLLAWLRLLALDGALAKAEPKTLRPVN